MNWNIMSGYKLEDYICFLEEYIYIFISEVGTKFRTSIGSSILIQLFLKIIE